MEEFEGGEIRTLVLPWTEVCMHMQVAGKVMQGQINRAGTAVQLLADNKPFGFPISRTEAGW